MKISIKKPSSLLFFMAVVLPFTATAGQALAGDGDGQAYSASSAVCQGGPAAGQVRLYKNGTQVPSLERSSGDFTNMNEALAVIPSNVDANGNHVASSDSWKIDLGPGWNRNEVESIKNPPSDLRCAIKDNGQPATVLVDQYADKGPSLCGCASVPAALATSLTGKFAAPQGLSCNPGSIAETKHAATKTAAAYYTYALSSGAPVQCAAQYVKKGYKLPTKLAIANTKARGPQYCANDGSDVVTAVRYGLYFDVNHKDNLTIESACGNALSEGQTVRDAKDAYQKNVFAGGAKKTTTLYCSSIVDVKNPSSPIKPSSCQLLVPGVDAQGNPAKVSAYIISATPSKIDYQYSRCVYTNPDPRNGIGGYYDFEIGGDTLNVDRGCSATFTVTYLDPAPAGPFVAPGNLSSAVIPGVWLRNSSNVLVQNVRVDGQISLGQYQAPTPGVSNTTKLICGSWDGTEKYCYAPGAIQAADLADNDLSAGLVATHNYQDASGKTLIKSSCALDAGYPVGKPAPDFTGATGYYASAGSRLVVGNGCIGSFNLSWSRDAGDEINHGDQNVVLFQNYVDSSQLSGNTWDLVDGTSKFWDGVHSVNWGRTRNVTAIDGIVVAQGNQDVVLMENVVADAMEGVRFQERKAFGSGDQNTAPAWDETRTLLALGNTVKDSLDSGLLFYTGGEVVLAPSYRDTTGLGFPTPIPVLMTGNARYAVRIVQESGSPQGNLVTTTQIINNLIAKASHNGLGLSGVLLGQDLTDNTPPKFNLAACGGASEPACAQNWTDLLAGGHLAALVHTKDTTTQDEYLTCQTPPVEDQDELVNSRLATNPVVAQLPGIDPDITSLVAYQWLVNSGAGFTQLKSENHAKLDLAQFDPANRASVQIKCQVALSDGIDQVEYFNPANGSGVTQAKIAAGASTNGLIPAESASFFFDSDSDGVPDSTDCAPNDSSKWVMLPYASTNVVCSAVQTTACTTATDGFWHNTDASSAPSAYVCSGADIPPGQGGVASLPAGYSATPVAPTVLQQAGCQDGACNVSGADLSGLTLANIQLTGADLSSTNLSNSNLSSATLSGSNLSSATLASTNLSGASINNANLAGTSVTYSDLSRADLSGSTISGATIQNTSLAESNLIFANLSGSNLSGVDLTGAKFLKANLVGAHITSAGPADLTGALISKGTYISLQGGAVVVSGISGICRDASCSIATFVRSDLNSLSLGRLSDSLGQVLQGQDITSSLLIGADLSGDSMVGTNFSGANLIGAAVDLTGAIVTTGTVLPNVTTPTSDGICVSSSCDTVIQSIKAANIAILSANPAGFVCITTPGVGGQNVCDLSGGDLSSRDLSRANLSTNIVTPQPVFTNLSGADLHGAVMANVNMAHADLSGANLQGNATYISASNLQYANLTGANLHGTIFSTNYLDYSNLSGANLTNTQFVGNSTVKTNLGGADMTGSNNNGNANGYAVGFGFIVTPATIFPTGIHASSTGVCVNITCSNISFHNQDLSNANLTGIDLHGADLTVATNMSGATVDMTGALVSPSTILPSGQAASSNGVCGNADCSSVAPPAELCPAGMLWDSTYGLCVADPNF